MSWKVLSYDAKNVLEWLEYPYIGRFNTLTIEVGKLFSRPETNIRITKELFNEIYDYVKSDSNIRILAYECDALLEIRLKK